MTLKELERRVELLRGARSEVTVCFMDRTRRTVDFLEAVRLCAGDENVIDALAPDETGTSLLRAIIDADKDFESLPELAVEAGTAGQAGPGR